ncbi:MAG TPA: HIT family protein [Bacteroidales bacterium]|jgi:histidine triad (HIT) family protein|nr:HIT family protein [Bacteroidales bacterium]MDI9532516.1 HIT family protein [Bacteroidota bacterium]OPZ57201.1 MAG: HIT-like protein [Bacteroidetes bacterium ADurb.BinA012]MBK7731961.1 HIT family protein [Bacteroidales bacterium]MBP7037051.1 HIT family protein [Bacteroidales bacterium]
MASIFTRIINGEIPCYRVAENDRYIAFLDVRPLKAGHTLVVPKKEVDYIFDMDDEALSGMIIFAGKVARAMKEVIECNRIGVAVIGLEVPHAHIHLIPISREGDMLFTNPRVSLSPEENERLAKEIGAHVKL